MSKIILPLFLSFSAVAFSAVAFVLYISSSCALLSTVPWALLLAAATLSFLWGCCAVVEGTVVAGGLRSLLLGVATDTVLPIWKEKPKLYCCLIK